MRKLLIADCSEEYRTALTSALSSQYQVLCCRTGTEALSLLQQEQPDILVLDLMLPELDGLTLLERVAAKGICPMVLAATPILSDYVLGCAQRLGIEYLVRKPCDIDAIASRVQDLSHKLKTPKPRLDAAGYISDLLLSLGFLAKHDGFGYLREAVLLMAKDPTQPITKVIYPEVARTCGCGVKSVEHSIRTALEKAWDRGDRKKWQQLFPGTQHRPSNLVLICRLVEALLMAQE